MTSIRLLYIYTIFRILKKEFPLSENKPMLLVSFITFTCAIFSYFYIDQALAIYFHNIHTIWVSTLFHCITKIGDSQYSLVLLFLLFILYRQQKPVLAHKILYLFSIVAISGILVDVIKVIVARERPNMLFDHELYGFVWFKMGSEFNSFPSGHSATAFALCIGLTLLFPKYKHLYIFIAILVVMSRVVLNFHYLSDTLIGSLLGGITALYIYQKYFINSIIRQSYSVIMVP